MKGNKIEPINFIVKDYAFNVHSLNDYFYDLQNHRFSVLIKDPLNKIDFHFVDLIIEALFI